MRIHFTGVAGAGMSALAQLRAMEGAQVTGSDRLADRGGLGSVRARLEAARIKIFPQDGSGVALETARVVVSTAIEADNLDIRRAQELKIPVVHRADELAAVASGLRGVAVAGTSGKSTVTAMIFHILEAAGRSPWLAAGANVTSVRDRGLIGNAWRGESDLLVIEADESDGTLTRYRPWLGVLLNMTKDHKDVAELRGLFGQFRSNSKNFVVNADAPGLEGFQKDAVTFGFAKGELRATEPVLSPDESRFSIGDLEFRVPMPGRHNAENALAAVAACAQVGVGLEPAARALRSFEGLGRRFERVGSVRDVEVIDDFAHNPEKVRAAVAAARLRSKRILAVFQLHGFAPARFMKAEFLDAFAECLGPEDVLWFPDIYYVGGTAAKDISSRDYAEELVRRGRRALAVSDREEISSQIAAEAKPGDLVLVMGARDATLSDFARLILARLDGRGKNRV